MTVPAFNCHLVTVNQHVGRIGEMSVAESAGQGDGGARINRLNRVHDRHVRKPRNVADGTELTGGEGVGAGESPAPGSGTHPAQSQTKARDPAIGTELK